MIANTVTTLVYSAIDNSLVRELEQEGFFRRLELKRGA
jgi:hypothetical protein